MKILLAFLLSAILTGISLAGDWGKAPVDKIPAEECVDLGGVVGIGYHNVYVFKGYVMGQDTVTGDVTYAFEGLGLPVTFGARYANMAGGRLLVNAINDDLALSMKADLPSVAGIKSSLTYTYHFYTEDIANVLYPSSHGEVGLHLAKDLDVAVLKFDLFYNNSLPNAWNGMIPGGANSDNGAWFWDLGLEREFEIFEQGIIVGGGVTYADNYWGAGPNLQNGGRSSGWSNYYLNASVPIELNCRTVLTPYIGYLGAPDGWLMDGMPNWLGLAGQSDMIRGGVNMSVSF